MACRKRYDERIERITLSLVCDEEASSISREIVRVRRDAKQENFGTNGEVVRVEILSRIDMMDRLLKSRELSKVQGISQETGKADRVRDDRELCPVCLGLLKEPGQVRIKTRCGHKFHFRCLRDWSVEKRTCPLCREEL